MSRIIVLLLLVSGLLFAEDEYDKETQEAMQKYKDRYFGIDPHYANYLLPFGITSKPYKSYVPSDEYKKYEAELQVSLKLKIVEDLFGLGERYYLSYTHKAMWQLYADSSPFRETNYNPEAFVLFPMDTESLKTLKSLTLSFSHLSNGQGDDRDVVYEVVSPEGFVNHGHRSRAINYLKLIGSFEYGNFYTNLAAWLPIRHNEGLKDNSDIMDYMGYGSVQVNYFHGKNMLSLTGRLNPETGYGSLEGTYSYPLNKYDESFIYIKGFHGYGESLIDYNNNISKISIGFSFSR